MRIDVHNSCRDFDGYRAARVKSLFNCESGADFELSAEIPADESGWQIGLIVGRSGSGKSSLLKAAWPGVATFSPTWPADRPIIDAIAPSGQFDDVTAALAAVGLGSVPAWLRPWKVLSVGEAFRANLARLIAQPPPRAKLDEFTSAIDRQVARFGSMAFAKAWRRTAGQVIISTCHRDVADWLDPDWTFDTDTGELARGRLRRRPPFNLDIFETNWRHWSAFEPHHYLKLPRMIGARCYVGVVEGEPVAHVAFATRPGLAEARACRLVVMPEWQGAGVGLRFLNEICERWRRGQNRYRLRLTTLFHTSHPGLCRALRRDPRWAQVSARLHGEDKSRSIATLAKSGYGHGSGYGGHFRAVQGFRYYGQTERAAA